jgi:putative addiction module killer protein
MNQNIVDQTEIFTKWFRKLKDRRAQDVILIHIGRMIDGNLGQDRNVGDGIWEKKINYGPGYRLYYFKKDQAWILLICGGDKSTQANDIKQAKRIKSYLSTNRKGQNEPKNQNY